MKDNYEGDDTPANVHKFYDEALAQGVSGVDGKTITWGKNLEWFCYGQKPWKAFNSGALGSGEVQSWTYTKGKTKSNPASENTTYVVQPADFGKELCRYTYAKSFGCSLQ